MRLLPKNPHVGWTPYAWLIYLAIPLAYALWDGASAVARWTTLVGTAIFLVLYFRGFWVSGRKILPIIAAIVLIGVVVTPFNSGGAAFFIYGAAFLGHLGRPGLALRYLAAIVAVVLVVAWTFGVAPQGWIPAAVFSVIIGGVNIHYDEVRRANARLALAQDEVERLAQRAERERIARDLHDLLGHSLSVITLKAQLAGRLATSDPERAGREMRDVEEVSRSALAEVRRAVEGYRLASLGAELSRARVALGAAGVSLDAEPGPFDLDTGRENALALALREGVTNVLRHAGADRCRIAWRQGASPDGGREVRLEVEDDGKGLGKRFAEGSGLAGMRERVEALGGTVCREAAAEGRRPGTRLVVRLPLGSGDVPVEKKAPEASRSLEEAG